MSTNTNTPVLDTTDIESFQRLAASGQLSEALTRVAQGARVNTDKPVDRTGNTFCGPLVIAAILGTSTGRVAEEVAVLRTETRGVRLSNGRIKRVRRRTADSITGTYDSELFAVLTKHGVKITEVDIGAKYQREFRCPVLVNSTGTRILRMRYGIVPPGWHDALEWTPVKRHGPALWQWLNRLRKQNDSGTYIVNTPGHWAIVSNGKFCETFTKGEWVPFHSAHGQNRQVLRAWRIS